MAERARRATRLALSLVLAVGICFPGARAWAETPEPAAEPVLDQANAADGNEACADIADGEASCDIPSSTGAEQLELEGESQSDICSEEDPEEDALEPISSEESGVDPSVQSVSNLSNGTNAETLSTVSTDETSSYPTVYSGSVSVGGGKRSNAYAGSGSSDDPYRFLVEATNSTAKGSNPYTQPSQFWGESQSAAAAPAKFAVVFEQRDYADGGDPSQGHLISSMSFDTVKNKNPNWANFGSLAPKISPVTAFDTSTGELRLAFAWKGDFSKYFTSWEFKLDAVSLTQGLEEDLRAEPGDVVQLTYYGNFQQGQTSRSSDFSIDFPKSDSNANLTVSAVVGDDGYAIFSGDQTLLYGGNYALSVTKPADVPVQSIDVSGEDGASSISEKGGSLQMRATVLHDNATDKKVAWSIEGSEEIASIDKNGLLHAQADGTVVVRATAVDGSGVFGECQVTVSGQSEPVDRPLYAGNVGIGDRSSSGEGSGTADDPYIFAVAPAAGSDKSANPYTRPSQFWGVSQAIDSKIAPFAVEFLQFYDGGSSGKLVSSMSFDTITKRSDSWNDFSDGKLRLSPVTAFDTSSGDLRVSFAWKGCFSSYFSDWTYRVDVQGLTSGLQEEKRVQPGDTVYLTYYGNYQQGQTSGGTDYSIDFSVEDSNVSYEVEAVVGEDGFAEFSGDQMIQYGGNYVLSLERSETSPNPSDEPDDDGVDSPLDEGSTEGLGAKQSGSGTGDFDAKKPASGRSPEVLTASADAQDADSAEGIFSSPSPLASKAASEGGAASEEGIPYGMAFAGAAVVALAVSAAVLTVSSLKRKGARNHAGR